MVYRGNNGKTIATVDDFGLVKLFAYPCVDPKSSSVEYRGHSSHVTNCCFTFDDKHLVTTGGADNCVFQWRHEVEEEDNAEEAEDVLDSSDCEDDPQSLNDAANDEDDVAVEACFEEERSGGDEFMAVKPWLGAISPPTTVPSAAKEKLEGEVDEMLRRFSIAHNAITDEDVSEGLHKELVDSSRGVNKSVNKARRGKEIKPPENNMLELEWIHGYCSSGDSRGNVRYTSNGDLVYHAASMNVVLSCSGGKKTQRFIRAHDDDVTTLAIHPDGNTVATGQIGKVPDIKIWDSTSGKTLQTLSGFHRRGICRLAFSDDGSTLISVGNDNDHSIAIYDWANKKLKASAKGDKAKILDVVFKPRSTTEFATCGVKHVKFWTIQGLNVSGKKAILGKKGKLQAFPTCAFVNESLVVGTADGSLYKFVDRQLKLARKAHDKAINTFFLTGDNQLVSAGRDGQVMFWDTSLNNSKKIDVKAVLHGSSCRSVIRSVCLNSAMNKLLLGTEGSEIFELDVETCQDLHHGPLVCGHYKDELWGLAESPVKREFATVGDDGTLRLWDLRRRGQREGESRVALVGMARAVCYSPDGRLIAVGFGGSVGKGRSKCDGEIAIYNAETLEIVHKAKDSKEWIQDLKFAPDGKTLAVGSHDNTIYFYTIDTENIGGTFKFNSCKLRSKFSKHSSFITHLDFSEDSTFLRSNCGAYELLFSDVFTGNQIKSSSSLRDTHWSSDTCVLGWAAQGIWIPEMDGSDINACVRSHSGSVLVTGADDGKVRLYQYPCVDKKAGFVEYLGHSSHVCNARWSLYDECLLTVGGGDRCIFQWKHVVEEVECNSNDGKGFDGAEDGAEGEGEMEMFFEARGEGDQFMAVKPYLGAIKAPTRPITDNPMQPEINLSIDWVFGHNARGGVKYNANGGVCYSAAALGIQLRKLAGKEEDSKKMEQKFCRGHDDDVKSFAMSADKTIMATGQMGKKPCVKVWDAESCLLLATLTSKSWKRGITCITFNADGSKLCATGNDDDHSLVCFEDKGGRWSKPEEVASGKGDKGKVLWLCWDEVNDVIVCGGVKFLKFFSAEGKTLKSKKGVFGKKAKIQPLPCGAYVNKKLVTGTADGKIYVWEDRKCVRIESIGEEDKGAAVNCCECHAAGLVCGDKAGNIAMFDNGVKKVKVLGTEIGLPVRSVDVSDDGGKLLVATDDEILEIGTADGQKIGESLMHSHTSGELWGLSASRDDTDLIATTGDDKTLRLWNIKERRMVGSKKLSEMSRAVAFGANGLLAIGLGGERNKKKKGKAGGYCLLKVDGENRSVSPQFVSIKEEMMAAGWVSDIKLFCSKKKNKMALGSHDNKVYLYDTTGENTKLQGNLSKHSSYITHIDFSDCGKFLQSACGAYELLFWNTNDCKQITASSSLRDVEWDTWTSTLGWPVQQIWPEGGDGTDVNAVCVLQSESGSDKARKFVFTGDDFGLVKCFNYPVITKGAASVEGKGHASHVTNVTYAGNGNSNIVVSVGGNDRTIIVWKISEK